MSTIGTNCIRFRESLPKQVTLVAVSKTKPIIAIQEAYDAGQRIFGENKIQEMTEKWEELPKDIQWHMIGHVQTNKVKYMIPFVSLIHSVDRIKLLKEINRQAERWRRQVSILLQVKIAQEDTKFGMPEDDLIMLFENGTLKDFPHVQVKGLMGMASFTQNEDQIGQEFSKLKTLYDRYKTSHQFDTLSMGMSGDYKMAIQNGSTMVRIGSTIFGHRNS